MSRVRLVPVIFIIVITLSILFGSFAAYRHFKLIGPLQSELQSIAGVKTALVETGNPGRIIIKLGPVDKLVNQDLQSTYVKIVSKISGVVGNSSNLTIEDNRNAALTLIYESLRPILNEGIAKGNYTEMIASVEKKAVQQGVQVRVTMDAHNIYIQLSKGSYYLYDVYLSFNTARQGGGTP